MKTIFITIYLLLVVAVTIIPFGIGPIIEQLFEEEVEKAEQDLARGTFALMARELDGLSPEGMKEKIRQIQPDFGYPVGVYRFDQLAIEEDHLEDFRKGRIVCVEDKDMLVQVLQGSDLAMAMGGPFPGEELDLRAGLIFWGALIIALALPAMAWTFFLARDMRKIEHTASRFAAGDHGARVKVPRISSMTQIALAFNHMAEKTQKLMQSQKEFSNSVSHEIRTPLARIKFSLEMLFDRLGRDKSEKDYVSEIRTDVEEIESLVDDMLTYARFERESGPPVLAKNEIIVWLKTICLREQKGVFDKNIRFRSFGVGPTCIVRFEPKYLGWAVRNIIRNGIKYAEKNVKVVFEAVDQSCHIHVDDDGPGIPLDRAHEIFKPFVRLDKSRDKRSGGYGLGLAIASQITAWHGGTISAGISPMNGARFTITLPAPDMAKSQNGPS